jgi:CRISPR-associated protein (TIGR03986 family)
VKNRVRIEATLITATNLHLGDGGILQKPITKGRRKGEPAEVQTVMIDHEDRACIPGMSVKGAIRAWLDRRGQRPEELLGSETQGDSSVGGKGEFAFARSSKVVDEASMSGVPEWNASRNTGIEPHVAIDRYTKTAAPQKLFHREFVPPGVKFTLTINGCGLDDDEIALLLWALRGVTDDNDPLVFGADTQDGWGRFRLDGAASTAIRVSRLDSSGRERWMQQDHAGYQGLPLLLKAAREEIDRRVAALGASAPRGHCVDLSIQFDGPFLVNDPSRAKAAGADESDPQTVRAPDHSPVVDADGKPVLPGSSFRGALRAQMERIGRTVDLEICDPTGPDACSLTLDPRVKQEHRLATAVTHLCPACRLFGAPGWRTRVALDPFQLLNNPPEYHQELVAIDRFTGGVAGSAKFDVDAYWQPLYKGRLCFAPGSDEASLGLLALALRDLAEGDVTIGFGAAKGFGACQADVEWSDATTPQQAVDSLRESLKPFTVSAPDNAAAVDPDNAVLPELPATPPADAAFHNPYHFAPAPCSRPATDLPVAALASKSDERIGHRMFADETFSGRLVCRLEVETPLVVGAKHDTHTGDYTKVHPFRIPVGEKKQENGEIALPATSLRGMISSIAEAASNSALRVLENDRYSVRSARDQSLQAIGEIVGTKIRPLALPALDTKEPNPTRFPIPASFRKMFARPNFSHVPLKAYVDGYETIEERNKAPRLSVRAESFLSTRPSSYSADNRKEFWYAKLLGTSSLDNGFVKTSDGKVRTGYRSFLLGARIEGTLISEAQWVKQGKPDGYTRGILRVLGIEERETEIPSKQKKHEIFVPYPEGIEDRVPLFEAGEAIETFHQLANERTDSQKQQLKGMSFNEKRRQALPYSVEGSKRNAKADADDQRLVLRDGDLVFFTPTADGTAVRKLAVSSIWRERVDGSTFDFFRRISPEILPFNPDRKWLTIAEQMFGFVEAAAAGDADLTALASHVRLSPGRIQNTVKDPLLEEVPLRILASPKPPSPNLYFRRSGAAGYTSKRDLRQSSHLPMGRKFYLHGKDAASNTWETGNPNDKETKNQKAKVQPIDRHTTFVFHVDFDNLSPDGLDLLCYAVRPTEHFRHKLGMGKALGLGRVRIDPLALFQVNRRLRYLEDRLDAPRYHRRAASGTVSLPSVYGHEQETFTIKGTGNTETAEARARRFRNTMHPDIRRAFDLLGDPRFVQAPVHAPQLADRDLEVKTFEWFVRNESPKDDQTPLSARQYLIPLSAETTALPPLYRRFDQSYPRSAVLSNGGGPHLPIAVAPRTGSAAPKIMPPQPHTPPDELHGQPPKTPEPLPETAATEPVRASNGTEDRLELRAHVSVEGQPPRFVAEVPGRRLFRAVRGTEHAAARRIGALGADLMVTLDGVENGGWKLGTIRFD